MTTVPHIQVKAASVVYGQRLLFERLAFDLPQGQWVALLGKSGTGKSSLLRGLAGLNSAWQAEVVTSNNTPLVQQIAYMGQRDVLLPWLNVLENTLLCLKLRPYALHQQQTIKKQALSLLEQVKLTHALNLYPQQLSGGMRQRVALVRMLLEDKPIALMDEPFSALDAVTRFQLQTLAVRLLSGKTVLFITHDPTEACRLANHIYLLEGAPAKLQVIARLSSPTPRPLEDMLLQDWQAHLFARLLQDQSEAA